MGSGGCLSDDPEAPQQGPPGQNMEPKKEPNSPGLNGQTKLDDSPSDRGNLFGDLHPSHTPHHHSNQSQQQQGHHHQHHHSQQQQQQQQQQHQHPHNKPSAGPMGLTPNGGTILTAPSMIQVPTLGLHPNSMAATSAVSGSHDVSGMLQDYQNL
ncbi:hypothetical protein LSH36_210g01008 [Paralvinella palmiformis]|uniref:Uncharacterized protein n=1 Tax=Paralvinella palmiformis TaxID=53620 RepID=A0AAD9N732_9ANNE|nr:hypothetical protein LSH36_210g01008 [Paralvinella palmiformis]